MLKKSIVGLLCALIFFISAPVVFADVIVSDSANIFSAADVERMTKQLVDQTYNFHVVTVRSLDGEAIEDVSDRLLTQKRLGKKDILLTIAADEREVFLEVPRGSALDRAITEPIRSLLDDFFIPYAADGDFAGGVLALADHLLARDAEQAKEHKMAHTPPASDPGHSTAAAAESIDVEDSGWIGVLIALLVVAAPVVFFLRRKARTSHRRVVVLSENLLKSIAAAMEQLNEYLPYSQGTTGKMLQEVEQSLNELIQQANDLEQQILAVKLPRFGMNKKLKQQLKQQYAHIKTLGEQLTKNKETITRVAEVDRQMKQSLQTARARWEQVAAQFKKLCGDYMFSFAHLREQIDEIGVLIETSDDLEEFDPIEAKKDLDEGVQILERVEQSMQLVQQHIDVYAALPEKIASRQRQIDAIVTDENLKLVDTDPYKNFAQGNELLAEMHQAIKLGRTDASTKALNDIDALLEAALDQVRKLIEIRDGNRKNIHTLEEGLETYTARLDEAFARALQRAEMSFPEKHWRHLPRDFAAMQQKIETIRAELPEVKTMNDDSVQEYKRAQPQIDTLLSLLAEADETKNACLDVFERLMAQRAALADRLRGLDNENVKLRTSLEHHRIPLTDSLHDAYSRIQVCIATVYELLDKEPYALDFIDDELRDLDARVKAFARDVEQTIARKREVERLFRDAQSDFSRSHTRYERLINTSHYRRQFRDSGSEVERLIARGLFVEAAAQITGLRRLMEEMAHDYRRARDAEEEQMRRRAAARQNSDNDSFWGGRSSWSGGRRRGDSSWSGGHRGGRSSWGGGQRSRSHRGSGSSWGGSGNSSRRGSGSSRRGGGSSHRGGGSKW